MFGLLEESILEQYKGLTNRSESPIPSPGLTTVVYTLYTTFSSKRSSFITTKSLKCIAPACSLSIQKNKFHFH